jgi:hypothetical protein
MGAFRRAFAFTMTLTSRSCLSLASGDRFDYVQVLAGFGG